MSQPHISVIIPTWREQGLIASAVGCGLAVADEVIVADGGSPDETVLRACAAGARVVSAARGRGLQLNAGARVARGDVLLFCHADVRLPSAARTCIEAALADPSIIGGSFRLRFVPETRAARLFSWANHVRHVLFGIYYGDSCLFVRRTVFEALGGFPDVPLFEDYELARRLERRGPMRYVTECEVHASSRRFAERPIRTLALWSALQTAYSFGAPPELLARFYAHAR